MKPNFFRYTLFIYLALSELITYAQTSDSSRLGSDPFFFLSNNNTWISTQNPACITVLPFNGFGQLFLDYSYKEGNYRRVFQPESKKYFSATTEGYSQVKGVNYYGKMGYSIGKEQALKWNDVSFISENNPYVLGDSIGGNYDNEMFNLEGKIASKLMDNYFRWGIGLSYLVGNKSDQNDPRPNIGSMRISISPGLIINKGGAWSFGVNMKGERFKEDIDITVEDYLISYRYFRFMGLGIHQGITDDYFSHQYYGHVYGGGIQAQFRENSFSNMLEITAENIYERSQDGTSKIGYLTGDYKDFSVGISDLLRFTNGDVMQEVDFKIDFYKVSGTWFDQTQETADDGTTYWEVYNESVRYKKQKLDFSFIYSWITKKEGVRSLTVSPGIMYEYSREDFYPELYYEKFQNVSVKINTQNCWHTDKSDLLLMLDIEYRFNLNNDIYIDNIELKDKITYPEFYYQLVDFLGVNGKVRYNFSRIISKKYLPFIALSGQMLYVTDTNIYYKNDLRITGKITTGFIF